MRADVERAMRAVPREQFVPPHLREEAGEDHPLPIGHGQTISQPSLVGHMTELLDLGPGDRVLEIGTGSGFQTAVLAKLGYGEVYSVEIIPELLAQAAERLRALGCANVHLRLGDGAEGWPEHAPYNAIIVTAAPRDVPAALLDQLASGGRLVVPVGPRYGVQTLWKITRTERGFRRQELGWVAFVPLVKPGEPPDEF